MKKKFTEFDFANVATDAGDSTPSEARNCKTSTKEEEVSRQRQTTTSRRQKIAPSIWH
jgi:hypothetical protein